MTNWKAFGIATVLYFVSISVLWSVLFFVFQVDAGFWVRMIINMGIFIGLFQWMKHVFPKRDAE